MQNIETSL